MCTNHDELHYPKLLRDAALWMAGGNRQDRDEILELAALMGMRRVDELLDAQLPSRWEAAVLSRLAAQEAATAEKVGPLMGRVLARAIRAGYGPAKAESDSAESDDVPF